MKKLNAQQVDLAQRLLTHERREAEEATSAAVIGRVHAKLFDRLATLVGRNGAHAIFVRSVKLSIADYPFLKAIDLSVERANDLEAMITAALAGETRDRISRSAIALSATMLSLLETLIGEALTMKILRNGWPDFVVGNEVEEKKKR